MKITRTVEHTFEIKPVDNEPNWFGVFYEDNFCLGQFTNKSLAERAILDGTFDWIMIRKQTRNNEY